MGVSGRQEFVRLFLSDQLSFCLPPHTPVVSVAVDCCSQADLKLLWIYVLILIIMFSESNEVFETLDFDV